jgi:16S rRNA G966 N2-methylase RsmD
MPVPRALRTLARERATVDGIFADPPYGAGWMDRLVAAVETAGVLGAGGWIALEHRAEEVPRIDAPYDLVQTRRHGGTVLTLLVRAESAS